MLAAIVDDDHGVLLVAERLRRDLLGLVFALGPVLVSDHQSSVQPQHLHDYPDGLRVGNQHFPDRPDPDTDTGQLNERHGDTGLASNGIYQAVIGVQEEHELLCVWALYLFLGVFGTLALFDGGLLGRTECGGLGRLLVPLVQTLPVLLPLLEPRQGEVVGFALLVGADLCMRALCPGQQASQLLPIHSVWIGCMLDNEIGLLQLSSSRRRQPSRVIAIELRTWVGGAVIVVATSSRLAVQFSIASSP